MQVALAENGGRSPVASENGVPPWPPGWTDGQLGPSEGPTVCRTEWSSGSDGLQRRAQLETTHWSAPTHSYGKVVAGVEVVSGAGDGRAVHARRQIEVVSSRAPGMISVMRASHSSSHSRTSNTHFDDLQLSLNRMEIGSKNAQWSTGGVRSGFESSLLAPAFLHRSAIGDASTFFRNGQVQSFDVGMKDVKNESDRSGKSTNFDGNGVSTYKVNFPDNESEDSFYDSCPEKESVFKDESQQLEEWRRASKIRRSLQFPRRQSSSKLGKITDLPDNVGSVDRIKRELESINSSSSHSTAVYVRNDVQNVTIPESRITDVDSVAEKAEQQSSIDSSLENFTIKPSILKAKKFIAVERLNEVRERLKYLSGENKSRVEKNACEFVETIPESAEEASVPTAGIRSYVFGMGGNPNENERAPYPRGTNSLESRSSKTAGSSSAKNDDWYARRKSYGFEKVQNSLRSDQNSLSSRDRDNIESSTDSGIWRSTEIVNALSNSNTNTISQGPDYRSPRPVSGGIVTQGNGTAHGKETFEDWLIQNRKTFSENLYNCSKKNDAGALRTDDDAINFRNVTQNADLISVSDAIHRNELSFKNSLLKNNYKYHSERSSILNDSRNKYTSQIVTPCSESKPLAVIDSVKHSQGSKMFAEIKREVSPKCESNFRSEEDISERKNKKVEFCKTEVHFAAESGRVNIVETDGKPPSTNNFRRRRRSSSNTQKDAEKNGFPVMHFGDGTLETKTTEFQVYNAENPDDRLKLNFAVITEIKPTLKDSQPKPTIEVPPYSNDFNCDDTSEGDQPRGILKNKPVKPRPYHLGEDRQILPESNVLEKTTLWGVKLRPIQDTSPASLWKSSAILKNPATDQSENDLLDNKLKSSAVTRLSSTEDTNNLGIDKQQTYIVNKINNVSDSSVTETKGYSTKVNFGFGEPIIETSSPYTDSKIGSTSSNDYLTRSKPTLVRLSGNGLIGDQIKKHSNTATKIIIDVSPSRSDSFKNDKQFRRSGSELKSTALVRNTELNNVKYRNEMITIEKNKQDIKTALKSKLYESQKIVHSKDLTDDSADEEVRNLMIGRRDEARFGRSQKWRDANICRTRNNNLNRIFIQSNDTKSPTNIINTSKIRARSDSIEVKSEMKCRVEKTLPGDARSNKDTLSNVHVKKIILEEKYKGSEQRLTSAVQTKVEKESSALAHNNTMAHKSVNVHSESNKKTNTAMKSTFADSLSNPRAMMPARGSARKLKQHELSYFGVKGTTSRDNTVTEKPMIETKQEISETYKSHDPIYENVTLKSSKREAKLKTKHPGETIIEELTKAADEILQALDGYSDGINTTDDDERKNKNRYTPMATISETNAVKQKMKVSESKAVQANLSSKPKHGHPSSGHRNKMRTSSNSSLESLTRDTVSTSIRSKSNTIDMKNRQEKSHKKRVSSGEVVKARRLQRAHSRDALFHKHGSSSEDVTQVDVVRKKTKRVKHGSDTNRSVSKVLTYNDQNESIIDRSKESNRSIAAVTPDYNHKPAVSTIKSLHDKHSRRERDRNSEKVRSLGRERSHRTEKTVQNTLSSHAKQKIIPQEKSRSVDTSLERESGHSKEKIHSRDTIKKRTTSITKHSSHSKLKSEEQHSDTGKKVKSLSSSKSAEQNEHRSGSSSKNPEGVLHSHSKSSGTKTERIKKS